MGARGRKHNENTVICPALHPQDKVVRQGCALHATSTACRDAKQAVRKNRPGRKKRLRVSAEWAYKAPPDAMPTDEAAARRKKTDNSPWRLTPS
ncbi:hypothetical protein, partial [Azospirillum rugosum]|uniref:hypothetical protein n=1 Tax=Azospirillum rugosum TaxID=416170 RepID=UPI003671098D